MQKELPTINTALLQRQQLLSSLERIIEVKDLIFVNPDLKEANFESCFQSRSFYGTDKEITELEKSIRDNGILEFLIVCKEGDKYRVLEGNRRSYVLTKILKEEPNFSTDSGFTLSKVPVKVTNHPEDIIKDSLDRWQEKYPDATDDEIQECREHITSQVYAVYNKEALHRNTQRKQWTWLEQIRSCQYRIDQGESPDKVAQSQNISLSTLNKALDLFNKLKHFPEVMDALNKQQISKSAAALFTNVKQTEENTEIVSNLLETAKKKKLSVSYINEQLSTRNLKRQQRNRKKKTSISKPQIVFKNYKELTDFFLNKLLSFPHDDIEAFCEHILYEEELTEKFKKDFFNQFNKTLKL